MPIQKRAVTKAGSNGSLDRKEIIELFHSMKEQNLIIHQIQKAMKKGMSGRAVPLLGKLETNGVRYATLGRFFSIALGQIYLYFKEDWKTLPKRFRQAWSDDCYSYIQQKYGHGDQMADMYATVFEAIYSGRYISLSDIPKFVKLSQLSIAKQRIAAGYIIDGKMTVKRWKLLSDETKGSKELRRDMRKGLENEKRPGRPQVKRQVVLIRHTGDLRLYDNGNIEELGHLNINSKSLRVSAEVRKICQRCGIQVRQ